MAPIPEDCTVYGQKMPLSFEATLLGIGEYLKLPGFGDGGLGTDAAGKAIDFKTRMTFICAEWPTSRLARSRMAHKPSRTPMRGRSGCSAPAAGNEPDALRKGHDFAWQERSDAGRRPTASRTRSAAALDRPGVP